MVGRQTQLTGHKSRFTLVGMSYRRRSGIACVVRKWDLPRAGRVGGVEEAILEGRRCLGSLSPILRSLRLHCPHGTRQLEELDFVCLELHLGSAGPSLKADILAPVWAPYAL